MSVSGLCQVCETAAAQYACDQCGAAVCSRHYDGDAGLCTECLASARGSRDVDCDDLLR